ncbi:MAG: DUF1592 domain-containing protein [Bryobacteraceae bacterium]|nr:DUF1592 domain-containing protein [Bryobacteraceae bacterium]
MVVFTLGLWLAATPEAFRQSVRPVLEQNCGTCHSAKSRVNFLKATTAADIQAQRGLWRNVATQITNRTMPPAPAKITEAERLAVARWIDERLRQTACDAGSFAGPALVKRLNRREYRNTIRDLLGLDLAVNEIFPADGTGGEGFDTNGETLYVPPLLLERYLEAAQLILDRVTITPPLNRSIAAKSLRPDYTGTAALRPVLPGEVISIPITVYADGEYEVRVLQERSMEHPLTYTVMVDGKAASTGTIPRYESKGPNGATRTVRVSKGTHEFGVRANEYPLEVYSLTLTQRVTEPTAEKRATHYRLFQMEPGETPLHPRAAARRLLERFLRQAFRRPVTGAEVDRYLALYDRAALRDDPYEERIKLALKAVLVSPAFLLRAEQPSTKPGIQPLSSHELASRLSYFLWSTMPDAELSALADQGRLLDSAVLAAQVERMLDDPRSRVFANSFTGQWLGTKDLGGRVAPTTNDVADFYTPEVAADLREEPVMLLQHILGENRSLLDLLTANYTYLTERLVRFYQLDLPLKGNVFQKVTWPDERRAGVLGMGSVLAMTSSSRQTSPVLRGAWVLDTLFGTPVPPPPPDVPPLDTAAAKKQKITVRQKLLKHREDQTCATCHNLMDPIGFGLENFDWMGRWRTHDNGQPIDAAGALPGGDRFDGPVQLRGVLLKRQDEFLRHFTAKIMGYALGRALQDADHCTVQKLVDAVAQDGYRARTLLREVVLSVPFRNAQAGVRLVEPAAAPPKRQKVEP